MKYLWVIIPSIFLLIAVAIFRPVPILPLNECIQYTGILERLYQTEGEDFVFIFKDHKKRYYINRALDFEFNIDTLKSKLLNKSISVYYPDYYTPLDHYNTVKHLCHVIEGKNVIFDEYNFIRKEKL